MTKKMKKILILLLFICLLCNLTTISAKNITNNGSNQVSNVNQSFNDLNQTLSMGNYTVNLKNNYTCQLNNDSNLYHGIILNGSHQVIGENCKIDANNEGQLIFNVSSGSNIIFNNLTFKNSENAVYVSSNSNVMFINCEFIGNHANDYGGAVYLDNTSPDNSISFINCSFIDNSAKIKGGGIYTLNTNLKIINCNFTSNNAGEAGGAIFTNLANVEIINSNFINNSAVSGGGINIISGEIINSSFTGNYAETLGGAIYAVDKLNVKNTSFTSNKALFSSGAIYNTIKVDCEFSSFINNTGSVYALKTCTLNGNVFLNNNLENQYTIYVNSKDDLNANYNWWGNNQAFNNSTLISLNPSNPINQGKSSFTPDNWIILSLKNVDYNLVLSLNTVYDNLNNSYFSLPENIKLPFRQAFFITNNGKVDPENFSFMKEFTSKYLPNETVTNNTFIKVFVDNQTLSLNFNPRTLTINNYTAVYGVIGNLTGKLLSTDGSPIIGQHISLNLTNPCTGLSKVYFVSTDVNGEYHLEINLYPGLYTGFASYDNLSTSIVSIFIIDPSLNLNSTILTDNKFQEIYGAGANFTGKLLNSSGSPIIGQHVSLNLTNPCTGLSKVYFVSTDVNGEYHLEINLYPGEYKVFCTYEGTSQYESSNVSNTISVSV
ncbi:carboxypeptidase-like regulatory domain-containing protein [Methanobrevibacter sp. UBA417]|jgi:predicted outer membrane repeat protein|uniref:carboxypeptidase-like regulatory domain-containing protein n=1 Tax=Methanobrevibacter sp. UBA417 TaxID=1915487 RepID=UPI0039B96854